jgi:hypothetical protein
MLQPDRTEKIKALLSSPFEGERKAARAALERIAAIEGKSETVRPLAGTKAWCEAILEWNRAIDFCVARLGSPALSKSEINIIRNVGRNRGDPWSLGAREFVAAYDKLRAHERNDAGAVTMAERLT